MIRLILATACSWTPWNTALPLPESTFRGVCAVPREDMALKALDAWLKLYRTGKMRIHTTSGWKPVVIQANDSVAVKFGIATKAGLGDLTWAEDLKLILEAVAKLETAEAAKGLLEVAAIGLDETSYTREMAPYEVREIGETFLARLTSDVAREEVVKAARGESKIEKAMAPAVQAAAARYLGVKKNPAHRAVIEPLLGAGEVVVRVHAAEALGALGDEAAALALIAALEREQSDMVLPAIVQSLRTLYGKYLRDTGGEGGQAKGAAAPPESTRLAVRAALKALGHTTWRGDMVLLKLLEDFRSAEAVPALIGVLERFRDHPEELQSGKLSGLLQHRVHELLVAMTGAVYPATQPEKWRELWERDRDKIEVTKKHEPPADATTLASGFCGIPVQGSRVIFILDLSRSMTFKMNKAAATTPDHRKDDKQELSTRLDFALRELNRAMDSIAPNAFFNLITFNGDRDAEAWRKEMVPANDKNRESFRKHLAKLEADGGTNLWSALEMALKIKSLVYGDNYTTNVDEVFILSDGAPSVGDVLDPNEILRLVKESNRFAGMRINTIFISSQNTEERQIPTPWMKMTPEELMKRMAEDNGGKFVNL